MSFLRNLPIDKPQLRAMAGVSALTAMAGLAMLGHDVVVASHFATGSAVDAYQLAVSVPTLLANVLAGGTVLAVLVPELSRSALNQDDPALAVLIRQARRQLGIVLTVCVTAWIVIYPHIAPAFATAHAPNAALSNHLLWLLTPVLYFVGMASIDAAYLNSRGRFLAASIFPALMPLGAIFFTIALFDQLHIYSTAIGLLCGSICLFTISRLLTRQLLPNRLHNHGKPLSRKLHYHYIQSVVSSASLAGIILTDVFLASRQNPGDLAIYNYASRPVTLFLAFFTASVGNVILPTFSRLVHKANWNELRQRARFWIAITMLASLVSAGLWISTCEYVVSLLYERGAFSATDTHQVATIQKLYLIQVPFYMTAVIGIRLLNSLQFHRSLASINFAAFLVNFAVDMWLSPSLGLTGIIIGTDAAFIVWAILIVSLALRAAHRSAPAHRNQM